MRCVCVPDRFYTTSVHSDLEFRGATSSIEREDRPTPEGGAEAAAADSTLTTLVIEECKFIGNECAVLLGDKCATRISGCCACLC